MLTIDFDAVVFIAVSIAIVLLTFCLKIALDCPPRLITFILIFEVGAIISVLLYFILSAYFPSFKLLLWIILATVAFILMYFYAYIEIKRIKEKKITKEGRL